METHLKRKYITMEKQKIIFKKFCRVTHVSGMYEIPRPKSPQRNAFENIWGYLFIVKYLLFKSHTLLVSYYETYLSLILAPMAHYTNVLTESLTECVRKCTNVVLLPVLAYVLSVVQVWECVPLWDTRTYMGASNAVPLKMSMR